MNMSDMKNMIVLKNLPSNLVEEAIIILKENSKIHKYQTQPPIKENADNKKEGTGYIVKDAEMVISSYIEKMENNSPKKERIIKKLEKKYKYSLRLNLFLFFTTILVIIFSIV